eukprot:CAMPEP_0117736480 /NCGR_PEP_ID=MMETSP0947-20121206/1954_1 /TAXON_ID=44440 /ORGANISM="Chattonella subsalsa, Strain CCMP2191" /LENGTH=897 /DNA_ID=CAMNT_0005551777 /DNA_START=281 /DNA_END=2971 /DNA_ORIENTATION=+
MDMTLCLLAEHGLLSVLNFSTSQPQGSSVASNLSVIQEKISLSIAQLLMVNDIEEVGKTLKHVVEQLQAQPEPANQGLIRMASSSSETSELVVVPDEGIVEQVVQMGFSSNGARRAVMATKNKGMEEALAWAISHVQDDDFDDPLPQPKLLATVSSMGKPKDGNHIQARVKNASKYLLLLRKVGTVEKDSSARRSHMQSPPSLLFDVCSSNPAIENEEADHCVKLLDMLMAGSRQQQQDALLKRLEHRLPTIDIEEFCDNQIYRQDFLETTVCCDSSEVLDLAQEAARNFDASEYRVVLSHLEWWLTEYASAHVPPKEAFISAETTQIICKALTGSAKFLASMGSSDSSEGSPVKYLLQQPGLLFNKLLQIYTSMNGERLALISILCRLMLDSVRALPSDPDCGRKVASPVLKALDYKALMGTDLFPDEEDAAALKEGAFEEVCRVVTLEQAGALAKMAQRLRGLSAQEVYLAAALKAVNDPRLPGGHDSTLTPLDSKEEDDQEELAILDHYITQQVTGLLPKLTGAGVAQVAHRSMVPCGQGVGLLCTASRRKLLQEGLSCLDKERYPAEIKEFEYLGALLRSSADAIECSAEFGADLQVAGPDINSQVQVVMKSIWSGKDLEFVSTLCKLLQKCVQLNLNSTGGEQEKLDLSNIYLSATNLLLTEMVSTAKHFKTNHQLADWWDQIEKKLGSLRNVLGSITDKIEGKQHQEGGETPLDSFFQAQQHIHQELRLLLECFCDEDSAHEWKLDELNLVVAVRLRSEVMEIMSQVGWLGETIVPDLYFEIADIVAQGFSRNISTSDVSSWEATQQMLLDLLSQAQDSESFEHLSTILWMICEKECLNKSTIVKRHKLKLMFCDILGKDTTNIPSWDPATIYVEKPELGKTWVGLLKKAW